MNDVATRNQDTVPAVSDDTKAMMDLIQQIALNPEADVEKLRTVMDMKMEMFNRGAEIEFNAAMSKVQAEMEPVARKANNQQTKSKYALLEHIIQQVSPIWTNHGFALTFGTGESPKEDHYRVECVVSHRAGHSRNYHADLPSDTSGIQGTTNKTGIHGFGSTMSYGRRYLTCMIFNIALVGEDTDAAQKNHVLCVTNGQIKQLRDAAKIAGKDDAYICQKAQIQRIEDLPQQRLQAALNHLKKLAQSEESE